MSAILMRPRAVFDFPSGLALGFLRADRPMPASLARLATKPLGVHLALLTGRWEQGPFEKDAVSESLEYRKRTRGTAAFGRHQVSGSGANGRIAATPTASALTSACSLCSPRSLARASQCHRSAEAECSVPCQEFRENFGPADRLAVDRPHGAKAQGIAQAKRLGLKQPCH